MFIAFLILTIYAASWLGLFLFPDPRTDFLFFSISLLTNLLSAFILFKKVKNTAYFDGYRTNLLIFLCFLCSRSVGFLILPGTDQGAYLDIVQMYLIELNPRLIYELPLSEIKDPILTAKIPYLSIFKDNAFATTTGPLELIFLSGISFLPKTLIILKIICLTFDILTFIALLVTFRKLSVPISNLMIYACFPIISLIALPNALLMTVPLFLIVLYIYLTANSNHYLSGLSFGAIISWLPGFILFLPGFLLNGKGSIRKLLTALIIPALSVFYFNQLGSSPMKSIYQGAIDESEKSLAFKIANFKEIDHGAPASKYIFTKNSCSIKAPYKALQDCFTGQRSNEVKDSEILFQFQLSDKESLVLLIFIGALLYLFVQASFSNKSDFLPAMAGATVFYCLLGNDISILAGICLLIYTLRPQRSLMALLLILPFLLIKTDLMLFFSGNYESAQADLFLTVFIISTITLTSLMDFIKPHNS